jgi:hypothetical protein
MMSADSNPGSDGMEKWLERVERKLDRAIERTFTNAARIDTAHSLINNHGVALKFIGTVLATVVLGLITYVIFKEFFG